MKRLTLLQHKSDLRDVFAVRTGISLYIGTLRKALKEAGITRHKGAPDESADHHGDPPSEAEHPARYGYQDRHRQQAPEQRYPSCLTDAEWDLVADIFDVDGHRGTPPRYPRRLLVDACCYVVRSGC